MFEDPFSAEPARSRSSRASTMFSSGAPSKEIKSLCGRLKGYSLLCNEFAWLCATLVTSTQSNFICGHRKTCFICIVYICFFFCYSIDLATYLIQSSVLFQREILLSFAIRSVFTSYEVSLDLSILTRFI